MYFIIYLIVSLILALGLIIFIISFGLPMFTGAPYAVSSKFKIAKIIKLIQEMTFGRKGLLAVDIGSGDGRIPIALARAGFKAEGLEINPFLVKFSQFKIKTAGLKGNAIIKQANFWKEDFSKYDVVVLFGVFYIMEKLEKKLLAELKPGCLVFCNHFAFPTWKAIRQEKDIYVYQKQSS